MHQLWTIILITLLAIGFSLAAWLDRDEAKRRKQHDATYKQGDRIKD